MASFSTYFKDALEFDPTLESEVLAEYPIFNEDYRDWLNQQIKDQFWNREIGMETVSMFKLALRRKLNQIMPYYNKQYKADLLAEGVDPLQTMRVDSESDSTNTGSTKNTAGSESDSESTSNGESETVSESDSKARATASDFPQTHLSGNGDYASSGQDNVSRTTGDSVATETAATRTSGSVKESSLTDQSGNAKNTGTVTGSQGQTSLLIMQHRQTLVNVDVMVLNDLDELFYGLWSNSDSFTQSKGVGYGFGFSGLW